MLRQQTIEDMESFSFAGLGRTLVLSDLHLNTLSGRFEDAQHERIVDVCIREAPDALILNGDTLDLFFSIGDGLRTVDPAVILSANRSLVSILRSVPNLYLLAGAHDQAMRWNADLLGVLRAHFPGCKGVHGGLVDIESGIVVVPGSQWYYDNVVEHDHGWLSLTEDLTSAFHDFLLSGQLDEGALRTLYVDGELGFWYVSGRHYDFLRGMAVAFGCRIDEYFDRIASMCRDTRFAAWSRLQFYEEHRILGRLATLLAEDGGAAMGALASPYWRLLGRLVKERLARYLDSGFLDYPPDTNIPFKVAVVGHSHLVRTHSHESGRRILFTGSTKPQTQIHTESGTAENELGGGYAVIEKGDVRLERFAVDLRTKNLEKLSVRFA